MRKTQPDRQPSASVSLWLHQYCTPVESCSPRQFHEMEMTVSVIMYHFIKKQEQLGICMVTPRYLHWKVLQISSFKDRLTVFTFKVEYFMCKIINFSDVQEQFKFYFTEDVIFLQFVRFFTKTEGKSFELCFLTKVNSIYYWENHSWNAIGSECM